MAVVTVRDVAVEAVCSCLPRRAEDNLARLTELYGDAKRAEDVVRATGIKTRRIAGEGASSLDLCVEAAKAALEASQGPIAAVIAVTFTPERVMPGNACQAQHRLGLPNSVLAFDINLACSGYPYGLYIAGLLADSLGGRVLLLDGDVQTARTGRDDGDMVAVLADAGTVTIVSPRAGAPEWKFAFLTDGAKGDALTLPFGGMLKMDGFEVFRFVTLDVLRFLEGFMAENGIGSDGVDGFVPHQANMFMIRQVAKRLGFADGQLLESGEELGNSSSASIPSTLVWRLNEEAPRSRRMLLAGFGGGLSAAAAIVDFGADCKFVKVDK